MTYNRKLAQLAEQHRAELPAAFFEDLDALRVDLAMGRWPENNRTKGRRAKLWPELRAAILLELHALLCSDNPRYKDVRMRGGKVGTLAVGAVAGYVCGIVGQSPGSGAIAGAVAFIALAIANIGKNAFCRLPMLASENRYDNTEEGNSAIKEHKQMESRPPTASARKKSRSRRSAQRS